MYEESAYYPTARMPDLCSTAAASFCVAGAGMRCRVAPRKIGPAMASSSGARPCCTSFCMELRMPGGILPKPEITASASTFAPSAVATAQASRTQD